MNRTFTDASSPRQRPTGFLAQTVAGFARNWRDVRPFLGKRSIYAGAYETVSWRQDALRCALLYVSAAFSVWPGLTPGPETAVKVSFVSVSIAAICTKIIWDKHKAGLYAQCSLVIDNRRLPIQYPLEAYLPVAFPWVLASAALGGGVIGSLLIHDIALLSVGVGFALMCVASRLTRGQLAYRR